MASTVAKITERGYLASEVAERLGVSKHSQYAWKRKFAKTASDESGKDAEVRMLKWGGRHGFPRAFPIIALSWMPSQF